MQIARRPDRWAGVPRPGWNRGALPIPRRHLRQVLEGRPRVVVRSHHHDWRRIRRGAPHARRRSRRYGAPRGLTRVPARAARARALRRALRRQRPPRRARARHRRVPAGRRLAVPRRPPRARDVLPAGVEARQGDGGQDPPSRLPRVRPRDRQVRVPRRHRRCGLHVGPRELYARDAEADAFAYPDVPAEDRRRIRTNNVQGA